MSYIPALIERFATRSGEASSHTHASGEPDGGPSVLIRMAHDADSPRLRDLAELDGAAPLRGPALIALTGDDAWAAVSLADGREIADPFRSTAPAVALLRVRAAQLT
ncbi:MAG: hypothetical protein AVDCRST_MAG65-2160, partial [uncultured Solirubrobacteraceae bacterium]